MEWTLGWLAVEVGGALGCGVSSLAMLCSGHHEVLWCCNPRKHHEVLWCCVPRASELVRRRSRSGWSGPGAGHHFCERCPGLRRKTDMDAQWHYQLKSGALWTYGTLRCWCPRRVFRPIWRLQTPLHRIWSYKQPEGLCCNTGISFDLFFNGCHSFGMFRIAIPLAVN